MSLFLTQLMNGIGNGAVYASLALALVLIFRTTSILNFAPIVVTVPEGVDLRKVDLSIELQILSFYQQRAGMNAGPAPNRPDGEVTIEHAS